MTKRFCFRVLVLALVMLPLSAVNAQGTGAIQISQWAISAKGSSEYSNTAWGAMQATGAPNIQQCGDSGSAWASLTATGQETLTLYYQEAVTPTQVNIYQSFNPGAITSIDLIAAEGNTIIPVRNSTDPGGFCPGVFSINLPEGMVPVKGVVIHLDQTRVGNWNEIDAVELVGTTTVGGASSEPSSIEAKTYPQYNVWSNDGSTTTGPTTGPTGGNTYDFGDEWGTVVNCPNGTLIDNGIEFTVIQQRVGSSYRITALGLNGFDPVLAVMDTHGGLLCNDDDYEAALYSASLPTTGFVPTSSTSAQILYDLSSPNTFEDVTVVVGGLGGQTGEFIIIMEGMVATSADGVGDPFSLYISPALLSSGVTPTVYMISVTDVFDPFLALIDANYNYIQDDSGYTVGCDDAGDTSLCWGQSTNLSNSYVSRSENRRLPGGNLDAMLVIPLANDWGYYLNYVMSSTRNTYGDYLAVFHLGIGQRANI